MLSLQKILIQYFKVLKAANLTKKFKLLSNDLIMFIKPTYVGYSSNRREYPSIPFFLSFFVILLKHVQLLIAA